MPFNIYKNTKGNSKITEIAVYYNGKDSRCIVKYTDSSCKLYQLFDVPKFLNNRNLISEASADEIMRDSNSLITKQDQYYVFDPKILQHFFQNECTNADIIPREYEDILKLKPSHLVWYEFPEYFNLIAQTAINIIESYKGEKIFSLGQSPAWLVKAAKLIPTECELGYIPFSGNFYRPVSPDNPEELYYDGIGEESLHYIKSYNIDATNIHNYYSMLDKLKLNPYDIIEQDSQGHKKTVILEFTHSGSGLASFLSLLLDRTNELKLDIDKLKNAIKIVILVDSEEEICLKEIVLDKTTFKCSHLIVKNLPFTTLIWDLANGSDEDRLVPSYKAEEWTAPPKLLSNEKFIESLAETLKATVTTIYQQCVEDIIGGDSTFEQITSSIIGDYEVVEDS